MFLQYITADRGRHQINLTLKQGWRKGSTYIFADPDPAVFLFTDSEPAGFFYADLDPA